MSSVTVRGTASAAVTPDRAELSVALTHLAADPAAALDQVAAGMAQLEEMLAGHGFQRSDWATDGVQVAEEYQWKNDSNVLVGHRATTTLTVTIRRTELVGTVIRDGVTGAGASVRGLVWRVDADNPARRELLGAAAADAKVRALAYVEALDLRLGEVELISEVPIAPEPGPRPEMMMARSKASADSGGMEVSGGLVELQAEVLIRFAILR
jgi:uncharacterized protein YggE